MRKEERGEERDTTTHLIKIQIFTHTSRATNINFVLTDTGLRFQSFWGLYDPSVGSSQLKRSGKSLARLTKFDTVGLVVTSCTWHMLAQAAARGRPSSVSTLARKAPNA